MPLHKNLAQGGDRNECSNGSSDTAIDPRRLSGTGMGCCPAVPRSGRVEWGRV